MTIENIKPLNLMPYLLIGFAQWLKRPGRSFSEASQLGDDGGIFPVVLAGHTVEDLLVVARSLAANPLNF
jgi:hypothetical protein